METLTPGLIARHASIRLSTAQPVQFTDLTEHLERLVAEAGVRAGLINVQSLHTTAAVIVNEHEGLLLADFAAVLGNLVPASAGYRHDGAHNGHDGLPAADERPNGQAHCRALLLPSSAGLHVVDGRLHLGRWQRVFFVELDGPREREISVLVIGEAGR